MKKFFIIIGALLSVIIMVSLVASAYFVHAAGSLTITMTSASATPGAAVDLNIVISNNPGFNALAVGIVFPDGLSQINVVNNVANLTFTKGATNVWDAPEDYKGEGSLATVSVRIADDAKPGQYTVSLRNCMASDENFSAVPLTVVNAIITVLCPHTNVENRPLIPASCNNSGISAGVYCLECQIFIDGGEYIPATGTHTDLDGKWETNDTEHWHTCSCGMIFDKNTHSIGVDATCVAKPQCKYCGAEYGEINAAKHTISSNKVAEYKYWVIGSGANCQEYKKYYYECEDCKEITTEQWTSTEVGEHDYGSLVEFCPEVHTRDKLEPSIAAHYKCSVCDGYFTELKNTTTFDALVGATPQHVSRSYKSDSHNHWKECFCGKRDEEGVHTFIDDVCSFCAYDRRCKHIEALKYVPAKSPSCKESGNKEYWYCDDCNEKFKSNDATPENVIEDDIVIKELKHIESDNWNFDEIFHWKICARDNCEEVLLETRGYHDGVATCVSKAKCSVCNLEYGSVLGHNYSTDYYPYDESGHAHKCTNADCDENDTIQPHNNDGDSCEVCGYVYHICGQSMEHIDSVIGSCVARGRKAYYKCSCGKLYFDKTAHTIINDISEIETSFGAHQSVLIPSVPATCTNRGTTEYSLCTLCKIHLTDSKEIPATGHSFGEWTTTLEPTDFVDGSKIRTCSVCQKVEIASVPALGHEHTVVELPAIAPTCSATGLTSGSKCSTCEEIIMAQKVVPTIEHSSIRHVGANAATSTEVGNIEYWYCADCGVIWLDENRNTIATKEEIVVPIISEDTAAMTENTTTVLEDTTELLEDTTSLTESETETSEDANMVPIESTGSVYIPSVVVNLLVIIAFLIAIIIALVFALFSMKKRLEN